MFRGEFHLLGLFGVLGMMVLISAHSLLTIYLGLELLSLSMYAMVALQRDSVPASEAAMKYFVLGAIASGMLLYGMSMLYGVTGSLDLDTIARTLQGSEAPGVILSFGLVFVIIGVAFKLGAVPFHMWIPDVYHGAPSPCCCACWWTACRACTTTGRPSWWCWQCCPWPWATCWPLPRPTSSACLPIPPSPTWAS